MIASKEDDEYLGGGKVTLLHYVCGLRSSRRPDVERVNDIHDNL